MIYIILTFLYYYSCLYYFPSQLYRFLPHIKGFISETFTLLSSHSSFNYISILFFTFRNFNLYALPRLIFSIYCLFILPPYIYIFFMPLFLDFLLLIIIFIVSLSLTFFNLFLCPLSFYSSSMTSK